MKQQTLQEFIKSQPYYGHCTYEYVEGIEVGAEWQRERDYELIDRYVDDVMGGCNLKFKEWLEHINKEQ